MSSAVSQGPFTVPVSRMRHHGVKRGIAVVVLRRGWDRLLSLSWTEWIFQVNCNNGVLAYLPSVGGNVALPASEWFFML